jgi:Domain of unknown function (DUF4262)
MEQEAQEAVVIRNIEQFGLSVMLIDGTDYLPACAYTVGLFETFKHPELITFGLSASTLHEVLNVGGEFVKQGQVLRPETVYPEFFEGVDATMVRVDPRNVPDYFGYAIWYHKTTQFPCLQLVWTDRKGRYPWEAGFDKHLRALQPLLDRNADFKFKEPRHLTVFTTRQHLEQGKPILRVVHDRDGDWQFLTGDQRPEDGKVIRLDDMISRDDSLNELFSLDYGEWAERTSRDAPWVRGGG